jgi:hypothetical protein
VFKLAQENPELLRKVITIVKKNDGKVSCPFGDECVMFPCSKLSCHYDVLTNGVPGRGY